MGFFSLGLVHEDNCNCTVLIQPFADSWYDEGVRCGRGGVAHLMGSLKKSIVFGNAYTLCGLLAWSAGCLRRTHTATQYHPIDVQRERPEQPVRSRQANAYWYTPARFLDPHARRSVRRGHYADGGSRECEGEDTRERRTQQLVQPSSPLGKSSGRRDAHNACWAVTLHDASRQSRIIPSAREAPPDCTCGSVLRPRRHCSPPGPAWLGNHASKQCAYMPSGLRGAEGSPFCCSITAGGMPLSGPLRACAGFLATIFTP